jgi:3-dehydrosphinganine reductase
MSTRIDFTNRNVIITGGSSGIGLEIARQFRRLGARLHLLARDPGRLDAARRDLGTTTPVFTHTVDVTDQPALTAAIRAIGDDGGLGALICNAGIMRVGRFEELTPDDFDLTLRTNYLGTLHATRAAWPYLQAAAPAALGLVSSVAGYTGIYGYTAYAPTKFALTGLAECLRMEGQSHGIRVTIVFPPDTETPLLDYERQHAPPETRAITAGAKCLSAAAVAEKFVAGIVRGEFEVYCNGESRLIRVVKSVVPGTYYRMLDRLAGKVGGRLEK